VSNPRNTQRPLTTPVGHAQDPGHMKRGGNPSHGITCSISKVSLQAHAYPCLNEFCRILPEEIAIGFSNPLRREKTGKPLQGG